MLGLVTIYCDVTTGYEAESEFLYTSRNQINSS